MKLNTFASVFFISSLASISIAYSNTELNHVAGSTHALAPKVMIISLFSYEAEVWYGIDEFDLLAQNISLPGLSPLFPEVHCTANGEICQVVTGEAEINAAATISALVLNQSFNLTKTYFLVAGIAGINPDVATTGSVTFAKYAVQVALQYEFDAREIPANFSTGYVPQGSSSPDEYPQELYGTEVFEVSETLQSLAIAFASTATLNDTKSAQEYRARYAPLYAAGAGTPSVVACDVATADVYFSGELLAQAFDNTTTLWTNGSGKYCTTAQEDNAILEVFIRSTQANLTDFSRIIIMRTASDFDRAPPGISEIAHLLFEEQGGFVPAIQNIYFAGVKVVLGIIEEWSSTFEAGIKPSNYVGDILNILGGKPDFGLEADFISKRSLQKRKTVRTALRKRTARF